MESARRMNVEPTLIREPRSYTATMINSGRRRCGPAARPLGVLLTLLLLQTPLVAPLLLPSHRRRPGTISSSVSSSVIRFVPLARWGIASGQTPGSWTELAATRDLISDASQTDAITTPSSKTLVGASEVPATSKGSTAIILNVNARSVTPAVISAAFEIVGEDNVFVTRTAEEAKMAARNIVQGRAAASPSDAGAEYYSLVVPVGGDGTLSGWIDTMVEEVMLLHELEAQTSNSTAVDELSVEDAVKQLPLIGYLPMGTGNGLGYVIGAKAGGRSSGGLTTKRSLLSKINVFGCIRRRKIDRARSALGRLMEVGDTLQEAERISPDCDVADAVVRKCSVVEMPLMEVTHPPCDGCPMPADSEEKKGDLCFFAGAGFDSLMLHDFYAIKSWSKSSSARAVPAAIRDALSSVAGYCVALVTKTLPQTVKYGTHRIHVDVTTRDEKALWVDHRRGDFSEPAVPKRSKKNGESNGDFMKDKRHLVYSGSTGIVCAATTPFYGGGLRLFPYARLFPDRLHLRLGRISPLTGFLNIPAIFAGSYRETGERSFGCLDFVAKEFEVEVRGESYDEYVRRKQKRKNGREKMNNQKVNYDCSECGSNGEDGITASKGFPFQHSGESMGVKERFRLRVVQEPVKFVSFLPERVVVDE